MTSGRHPAPRFDRLDAMCAVVFAAAISLSLGWAFYLPVFQQQDESNHFDYAVTLFSIGRLIPGGEGRTSTDTHPDVQSLFHVSNGRAVRIDPYARVPAGYGSRAFYARLDSEAAPFPQTGALSTVPYISKTYPFLYYALAALVMTGSTVLAPHSIAVPFFAARLTSVAAFAVGLVFTWLSLRLLVLPKGRALAIFACTALLPMATWVGAYVQPDNLAFALIMLTVWFTLRANRDGSLRSHAGAGLALGLLIATKQQDAFALAVAILPAVALRSRVFSKAMWLRFAVLIAPLAAGYAISEPFLKASPSQLAFCSPNLAAGLAPLTISHALATVPDSLFQIFGLSQVSRQFWYSFGAYLSPIVIVSRPVTQTIAALLEFGTLAVVLLFGLRIVRTFPRVLRVARVRSPASAGRLLTANVLVTGYFVYFAVLLGVEAYMGDNIAIQGRYFYPFLPAVFMLSIWYAPRGLLRPFAGLASRMVATSILTFCVAANAFAFPSIAARYYTPVAAQPQGEVYARIFGPGGTAELGTFPRGSRVDLRGIAIDLRGAYPVRKTALSIDGVPVAIARSEASPRLACLNGDDALSRNGFAASIPTSHLAAGHHIVTADVTVGWSPVPLRTAAAASFTLR